MFEQIPTLENTPENKEKPPAIVLHFFRHSEKESAKNKNDDVEIALTAKGREMAQDSFSKDTDINQSVAFGGPKKRTQETALYHMLGDSVNEENFEKLKQTTNKDLKIGSKVGVNNDLDVPEIFSSQYKIMVLEAIKANNYLNLLIHESDKIGPMFDSDSETYSYKAAQIARVIKKYTSVLDRWEKLTEDESKDYTSNLERFLGTHGGIQECFLAKIIESIDGEDEREKFINSLPGNGFGFNEGIEVKIEKNDNGTPKINIEYQGEKYKFSQTVSEDLINEIADLVY